MDKVIDQTQALELIKKANSILIAPSTPDGDSIGSALALMKVLSQLDKEVMVISTNEVPSYLQFLPFVEDITPELPVSNDFVISLSTQGGEVDHVKYEVKDDKINIIVTPKSGQFSPQDVTAGLAQLEFDLIITVDTGDLVQLGSFYENNRALFDRTPLLNIDHHSSNGQFGTYNLLDFKVSATTQMLTSILLQLEKDAGRPLIDEDVATLLLVGIITDTGSFQHSNTTPEAFEVAADLLERGARQQEIIKHIFKTKSLATLKLWGRVLSKIQYDEVHRFVYSTITAQDLAETGAHPDDTGGIIDELMSNAPNAEVVMLLKEKEANYASGSLRAPGHLADVSEIAASIGGGGHKKAAGFRIKGKSMDEALAQAKAAIEVYMQAKLGLTPAPIAPVMPAPVVSVAPVPGPQPMPQGEPVFPGLVSQPQYPQNSIPVPSAGGEDLLLKDFRDRQAEEQRIKDTSVKFFQDADGQVKPNAANPEVTVGDVLTQFGQQ